MNALSNSWYWIAQQLTLTADTHIYVEPFLTTGTSEQVRQLETLATLIKGISYCTCVSSKALN
jgi:hypothetical protein